MIFLRRFPTAEDKQQALATMQYPNTNYTVATDVVAIEPTGSTPPTPHDYSLDYTTFNVSTAGTFKLSGNSIDYSVDDGTTWTTLANNTDSPTIPAGTKVRLKGTPVVSTSIGIGRFSFTGQFEVEGNIMSLIKGDNFINQIALGTTNEFYNLFSGCTGLTSAENFILPAITLSENCYSNVFHSCTNLVKSPKLLPATNLKRLCYDGMFYDCPSLTTAPELPATIINAGGAYQYMFGGCRSLATAPELPATTLTGSCYIYMFSGCTSLNYVKCLATSNINTSQSTTGWLSGVASTGTFVKASGANWPTGYYGIPNGWTVETYVEPVEEEVLPDDD